ncbi:hypothetical protein GOP47_0019209 [Adiantum capillus-veneris]|uniref:3-ketoacyl-CoA synthase n=1 Tax=Adiantum capillus-veneris TaxID=13818 RepID=A0A9D4UEZ3_ADICA|nr:hypothetical protein GOP47_0019209 [Adiantum capillus-veneris]
MAAAHPREDTVGAAILGKRKKAPTSISSIALVLCLGLIMTFVHVSTFDTGFFDAGFGFSNLRAFCMLLGHYRLTAICWIIASLQGVLVFRRSRSTQHSYLLDFTCFKPRDSMKCNYEVSEFLTRSNAHRFTLPSMHFQQKIFIRSGLREETYLPECIMMSPGNSTFEDARNEAEDVLFGSVQDLLSRANIRPQDISILITNCSLHSPTPSYVSMIVNHFKLREDCKAFHLGGMGCSASLIACKLASDLMRSKPNQYALVVSTENISLNWYPGNEKHMLVTNCLFRVGCAAMLLTNKNSERARCKYELLHLVRTHKAAEDKAFGCAGQAEDSEGTPGVALTRDLMAVAADALTTNIRTLGPLILPYSEQLRYVFSLLCRDILNMKVKQYQPDFKLAVKHFCLHAGGRAVIDEIKKNLYLDEYIVEPTRCTLQRWGNTSASSVWYVLAYMEARERIKANDKVWMLGLGSGFKCNSAVWRAISDVPLSKSNPWADCLHRYPVAEDPSFTRHKLS